MSDRIILAIIRRLVRLQCSLARACGGDSAPILRGLVAVITRELEAEERARHATA
jgi:hypothetical protein